MKKKPVQTAISLPSDRFTTPKQFAALAIALADSGVVDYQQPWDQLCSWWPSHLLWNERNTPLASVIKDHDSWADVYVMSAFASAVTNQRLGSAISMDSIRHGPVELVQTMATLSNLTEGKSIFMVGGGEIKQCKPFGWKRSEGLTRMEDLFKINKLMWECDGPVDFQGNHTKLEKAWLGSARQNKPRIWALGGGPKLMELATKYADGFGTGAPFVFGSPEEFGARVTEMKKELVACGRDPEAYDFGLFACVLMHDDPSVIDRTLDNPLMRYVTATMGRINMNDWDHVGIEPPMPRDWSYPFKLLPLQMTQQECDDMIGRTTRVMSEKSWIYGTPQAVAKEIGRYIDAGANWINVLDFLPMVLPLEEQAAALERLLEVCRLIKQH